MNYELFSPKWLEEVDREMKRGPSEERKRSVNASYWKWIDKCKQELYLVLCLVLLGGDSRYVYFEIKNGEVSRSFVGTPNDKSRANIVLSGTEKDWIEMIDGQGDLSQKILSRKIRLVDGNPQFFYKRIYLFIELLRCLVRVPIKKKAN